MSGYFGYTNGYGYGQGANAYPPGYVAQQYVRSYESYQANPAAAAAAAAAAAYNYNAYRAMAPPPPPPNQQTKYDYSSMTQNDAAKSYYYQNAANGYDAAVYSAASSLMQHQQTTSTAPKWPTSTPQGVNQLSKQNKIPFKRRNPTQSTQLFYCDVCKISCAGPQTYKEHLDGQKHKKREQAAKSTQSNTVTTPTTSSRSQNIIRCELCDVSCTGRDAYAAHLRGTKHQKTIKLHQKLGKPIPPDFPLATANSAKPGVSGTQPGVVTISAPPVINPAAAAVNQQKKVTTPTKLNFVGGSVLKTLTEEKTQDENMTPTNTSTIPKLFDINTGASGTSIAGDSQEESMELIEDVEPVGREYIEMIPEGKIITFHCKLCDCKFNDPNAKDMHLKGRRHRLAYKKKVDPSLRVDIKNLRKNGTKNKREKQKEKLKAKQEERLRNHMNEKLIQAISMQNGRRGDSHDDRHILAKHVTIHPSNEELAIIHELVTSCEKALKLVSDEIAEQDAENNNEININDNKVSSPLIEIKQEETENVEEEPEQQQIDETTQDQENSMDVSKSNEDSQDQQKDNDENQTYRALKGVMRVGLLAKSLLLKGDNDVQLVVLCSEKPTRTLLNRVYDLLTIKLEIVSQIKYTTFKESEKECLCVRTNVEPLITCRIYLTSPSCREENNESTSIKQNVTENTQIVIKTEEPVELLNKQKCLESLASLRHAKWFQCHLYSTLFKYKLIS